MRQPSAPRNNNAIIEYQYSFLKKQIKKLSKALEQGNNREIENTLEELTKMAANFSGNQIFSIFTMHDTPKLLYASEFGAYPLSESTNSDYTNCFAKLFLTLKLASNHISFLTFLFETVLNKLDETDDNTKNRTFSIFSASRDSYENELPFYLSQLSPEKIKAILSGDRLLRRIIDIKTIFSKQPALRSALHELEKHHEEGLDSARDNLRHALKMEINRLRNKNILCDTDIESSNILVDLRVALKKEATFFTPNELEIALNTGIEKLIKIHAQKKLDTETLALLSKIKMIKPWYLLEYRKAEKMFSDDVLCILAAPKLPTDPVTEIEMTAPLPASTTIVPRVATPPQQSTTIGGTALHFFNTPADIKALEAVVIPTHNPAVAMLKVPTGPIKRDIIDELFKPDGYKI